MRLFVLSVVVGLLCLPASASAERVLDSMLTLYAGESHVLTAPSVIRVSVGNSSIISSTLLEGGEIVLIAETAGETNIQFWFENGRRESVAIVVVETNGWRESLEVEALLGEIPGVTVKTIGRRIVVDGHVAERDLERIQTVKDRYPDILILAREKTPFEEKMLYFDVRVTEINRDVTEELGINWSKSFAGPSVGYEKAWKHNPLGMVNNAMGETPLAAALGVATSIVDTALGQQVESDLSIGQQRALLKAQGNEYVYWGISTSLVSMINLLEQNGAAITLSQPQLSARSGGTAGLAVGGEVPVVTSSISGQTVDYKDYGILLDISPKLDIYNNITAHVSVSVSQLDLANAVDGQPAFKKRQTSNDIKLRPGETLALSGLITREEQVAYSGLKWLSDVPVLGHLFKSKSFSSGETELVILLTPRVMDDLSEGVNKTMVERAAELVEEFEARTIELME